MVAAISPVLKRRAWILAAIVLAAFASETVLVRSVFLRSSGRDIVAPSRVARQLDIRAVLLRDPRPVKLIPRRLYSQPMPFEGR